MPDPIRFDPRDAAAVGLWSRSVTWRCADGEPQWLAIAAEPVDLPVDEPSEPVPGAIARWVQWQREAGGLAVLMNPAAALPVQRLSFALGLACIGVANDADEQWWDAALGQGMPLFALRGRCRMEASAARDPISALRFGLFIAEDGLQVDQYAEDTTGCSWRVADETVQASVVAAGGFEAAELGPEGSWQDTGREGAVRIAWRSATGVAFAQPRFVAPRAPGGVV